ncbi:MAG: hypothetical protein PF638_13010 [Candidatus Delongbacteria bacterium]|jgi:hypothetical protein|nr:hypothetical protein [Candidatus Delongbacteria bacterium]
MGDTLMVISSTEIKAFINDSAKDRALSRSFSITTSTSAERGVGDVLEVTATNATKEIPKIIKMNNSVVSK